MRSQHPSSPLKNGPNEIRKTAKSPYSLPPETTVSSSATFSINSLVQKNPKTQKKSPFITSTTQRDTVKKPDRIVSEIKVTSSPGGEETEAMVASTLLTVSSRVKERLKKRKNALFEPTPPRNSTALKNLLRRMSGEVVDLTSGERSLGGENFEEESSEKQDNDDNEEQEEDEDREKEDSSSEWRPVPGLVDVDSWSK